MTTIYYDGLCPLCSREIDHYRTRVGAEKLSFVDIFSPGFDASAEGLDPVEIHRSLHVRRSDGSLAKGVDAFVAIWNELPGYRFLSVIAQAPVVRPVMNVAYAGFAILRPYLPRRNADECMASPVCEMRPQAGAKETSK